MKFDQCLFGYADGHGLLASSLPLGSELSLLTELSDLAPGTIFGDSYGYWTGIPVPSIRRYALMRTWPAHEMPRPGCVWTHALLMEPLLLESIEDLFALTGLFVRPAKPLELADYQEPMVVDIPLTEMTPTKVDSSIVRRLLATLYLGEEGSIEIASPGQLDAAIFAIWSQQWPRLRRNFRFQTALSQSRRSSSGTRFDVTAVLGQPATPHTPPVPKTCSDWLSAAEQDVQSGKTGNLRHFLWHYGQDVRRQRGSFQPLVEIQLMSNSLSLSVGQRVIDIVQSAFPELDDARQLKQDLVDGQLVASAQAKLLLHHFTQPKNPLFPPPSATGIAALMSAWPKQSSDVLELAQITADAFDPLGRSVFESVTAHIEENEVWSLLRTYPQVCKRILRLRPTLVLTGMSDELDGDFLAELLQLLPDNSVGIDNLISHALQRNDAQLAKVTFAKFPDQTMRQVVLATNGNIDSIADAWKSEFLSRPGMLLKSEILSLMPSTRGLYVVANTLGWLTTPTIIAAGSGPWCAALKKVPNDLTGHSKDTFDCFLIALSVKSGGDAGRDIIELIFNELHESILESRLNWDARAILLPVLPELGLFEDWDIGLRLRLAVTAAYVRYNWPTQSYAKLARNETVKKLLARAAKRTDGGQDYYYAVL
ncbi:GAP1-N1 domain-containing protein [Parachitinimonas caeni]|uniref:Uncharacterized protein n=1 Tax=Parachitinimonas caeni TaxID=3031301 RepID=A0ABT7E1U9_9NEIS|nr:hypothetical protein [Parachitinimonas caeni]MDK2126224.1 hypothetical protein [Parachitinimonas caeni]